MPNVDPLIADENTMMHRSKHRGYVLVVTLILLAIVSIAMVGASRAALLRATNAIEGQRELQHRWGTLSCQRVFLPMTENILHAQEMVQRKPTPVVCQSIMLGDQTFDLVFADEQAKVSVNAILNQSDRAGAESKLRRLLAGTGLATHVLLRPISSDASNSSPLIGSFGQIFDDPPPAAVLLKQPDGIAQRVTCWGDGKLNFHRASQESLRELCVPALDLTQIRQLITLQNDPHVPDVSALLDRLQLTAERRQQAEALLSSQSNCHSLWVLSHAVQRTYYHLGVEEVGEDGQSATRPWEF